MFEVPWMFFPAINDYRKANGNGTDQDHPLFQTLGKHGPYQERGLTHKSVDCLIKSVVKKGSDPKENSSSRNAAHVRHDAFGQGERPQDRAGADGPFPYQDHGGVPAQHGRQEGGGCQEPPIWSITLLEGVLSRGLLP